MVVEIDPNSSIDPANEGRLIYIVGPIEVNEPLTEPEYGVIVSAVKLKRRVQMYQWIELEEDTRSWWDISFHAQSSISYITTWKDRLVDSTLFVKPFGHANPKSFPIKSVVSVNEVVTLGPFTLSQGLKEVFNSFILLTSDQRPERRDIKMHSGLYYHCYDVWNPEVGDIRVQLSYAGAANDIVTILALQVGSTLQPLITGASLAMVVEGEHSVSYILAKTFPLSGVWWARIFAYIIFYWSYSGLTFILTMAEGKNGCLLQAFVNNNKYLICHITTTATLFAVMGISWFPYSPLLGCVKLTGSLILIGYCVFKGHLLYCFNIDE